MDFKRRVILKAGGALGVLAAAGTWPLQALAKFARPEDAFKAEALDATFAALGGKPEKSDQIDLETPDIAENGAVVPVSVTSKLPGTEQIWLLVEKNPNPLAGGFMIPDNTEAFVQTRVKVAQTCDIYAVVKADGKLYMTANETKVTLGGCGG